MKRFKQIILIVVVALVSGMANANPPPENLSEVKKALKAYHDSGAYDADIAAVVAQAKAYIDQRLQAATPEQSKKFAIVYDIDETSLSNYQSMIGNDYGAPMPYVLSQQLAAKDTSIAPTLALYRYAASKGITQFFITGRQEKLREATIKNLKAAGYANWAVLYLEPDDAKYPHAEDYKAPIREKIAAQGYEILFSIGDQCSDLAAADNKPLPTATIHLPIACSQKLGDYEDAAFKLPNPYYYIP
jgi:predicted secreted acid phosphatase